MLNYSTGVENFSRNERKFPICRPLSSSGEQRSNSLGHYEPAPDVRNFSFGPQPPWKNDYLNWLEDPLLIDGASRCYRFGVKGIPEFEREHVINDYADVRHIFPSGHSVKGFLLAYGFDPIPEQFRQGTMAPGFAIVYDQFGREHRSPVELQAVRNRTPPRVLRKRNLHQTV